VRKDSTARGIQDLGGKKVCTTAGSTAIPHLNAVPSKPVPYILADFTDCLVAFQNGEVDAIATDDAILAGLAAQDPYAKIIGDRFSDEPYGIGSALGHPEFTRFVNGVLDQMRANGNLDAAVQPVADFPGSHPRPLPPPHTGTDPGAGPT